MPIIEEVTDEEALELKEQGNRAHKKGDFVTAERKFTEALQLAEDRDLRAILFCNRSLARLKQLRPAVALEDAEAALALDKNLAKALYRLGHAQLLLRRFAESASTFAQLRSSPDTALAQEAAAKEKVALQRNREQTCGDYDFHALFQLPVGASTEVAEYVGPVEVVHVPGKGRGLVATRDVEAGELLFVNRALAIAQRPALGKVTSQELGRCSRAQHDAFFLLCSGPDDTPQKLPFLMLEAGGDTREDPRDVDALKVQAILDANAHDMDTSDLGLGQHPNAPPENRLSGIFLIGSLVNHSCRPTSTRIFFGDLMLVRAATALRKGDEISDGYISVSNPSFERRRMLSERYGFTVQDGRALVEDALIPEPLAQPILRRVDEAADFDSLKRLVVDVESFVGQRISSLGLGQFSADVQTAASKLTSGLERMLSGAFMAVFVGVAVILEATNRHAEAAMAFSRCCYFMEENAPHNAYHASWAMRAFLAARKARHDGLLQHEGYARKVMRIHYGPGLFDAVLARASLGSVTPVPSMLDIVESQSPHGFLTARISVTTLPLQPCHPENRRRNIVEVLVQLPDSSSVQVDVSVWVVRVKAGCASASFVLPCPVEPNAKPSLGTSATHSRTRKELRLVLPCADVTVNTDAM